MTARILICSAALAACLAAQTSETPVPRLVQKEGRYALMVDGAPFLILGAQVNNSSAWPGMLPKVWPAIEYLHANTVEMPVYWEQFEPQPGQFDYTVVDTLLAEARAHKVRLVLLWFGTWKNGSGHYMPQWMKLDSVRYPRVVSATGKFLDSPSPHAAATLDADIQAFTALMRRLKAVDRRRTAIAVQVENEPGLWGGVRDFSPAAQKLFDAPVPAELLKALGKSTGTDNWATVFGPDAGEFFHAWSVATYIGKVAAAGKAVYPLPTVVNAALRDPLTPSRPPSYESGGPTDNVLNIWKAAAPAIDILAPDIYLSDSPRYLRVLDLYHRPDNALFIPETGNSAAFSRYLFAALGRQAIGYAPFGIDYSGYANAPLGATRINEEALAPFALNYRLLAPVAREIARLSFEGKVHGLVEEKGQPSQTLDLGAWKAAVSYGVPQFGFGNNPPGNPEPTGRVLVAQLAVNEFLVGGFFCRIDFQSQVAEKQRQYLRVEEVNWQNGAFRTLRIWNGDQTDWGLNLTSEPQLLRVTLATY